MDSNESIPPPKKKSKQIDKLMMQMLEERRNDRNNFWMDTEKNQDDDVDLFFKSIAMSVKKLSPNLIREAKIGTLDLLSRLECRNDHMTLPQNIRPS